MSDRIFKLQGGGNKTVVELQEEHYQPQSKFFACLAIWEAIKDNPLLISSQRLHGSAQACYDIRNLDKLQVIQQCLTSADELNKLQEQHNDGRGISCVRQVVYFILNNDDTSAKAICITDWDKIANYPDVAAWLKNHHFAEQDWYVNE
jgi:hypothetical protein